MSEVIMCDWCAETCCTGFEYHVKITQRARWGFARSVYEVHFCSAAHMVKFFAKEYGEEDDDEIV